VNVAPAGHAHTMQHSMRKPRSWNEAGRGVEGGFKVRLPCSPRFVPTSALAIIAAAAAAAAISLVAPAAADQFMTPRVAAAAVAAAGVQKVDARGNIHPHALAPAEGKGNATLYSQIWNIHDHLAQQGIIHLCVCAGVGSCACLYRDIKVQ